jgi:DNA-binding NarL/FixJ family response regulator
VTTPRVLLADADAPTRVGLRMAVQSAGFDVVAEVEDAESALTAAVAQSPDLALVAARLPGGGIAAAGHIANLRPGIRLIVVTPQPTGDELVAAVLAGAAGYVSDIRPERLPEALRAVLRGEVAIPRRFSGYLLDELRGRRGRRAALSPRASTELSEREWQVLELLGEGASTAAMASHLNISEVTVRRHVSAVVAKLGVRNRAAAAELMNVRSQT